LVELNFAEWFAVEISKPLENGGIRCVNEPTSYPSGLERKDLKLA
jgi:hypothetical protein